MGKTMKWTLVFTRKGERQETPIDTFESPEKAVAEASKLSPEGIHWTVLPTGRIGVTRDRLYMVKPERVTEKTAAI